MIFRLKRAIVLGILVCGLGTSLCAQSAWIPGRSNYSALYAGIKAKKSIKIMHIGDSHINRGYTSAPIREALLNRYGNNINFSFEGINGATYSSWLQPQNIELIKNEAPDMLIISLGTNDSYTRNFSSEKLRASMEAFTMKIKEILPNTKIILTTPPACYLRDTRSQIVGYTKVRRRHKRKPIYSTTTVFAFNNNTRVAVNTIKYFGQANAMPVIDLHASIGTKSQAEEWLKKGLMASDHVHFTELGYAKHGEVIASALISGIEGSK